MSRLSRLSADLTVTEHGPRYSVEIATGPRGRATVTALQVEGLERRIDRVVSHGASADGHVRAMLRLVEAGGPVRALAVVDFARRNHPEAKEILLEASSATVAPKRVWSAARRY